MWASGRNCGRGGSPVSWRVPARVAFKGGCRAALILRSRVRGVSALGHLTHHVTRNSPGERLLRRGTSGGTDGRSILLPRCLRGGIAAPLLQMVWSRRTVSRERLDARAGAPLPPSGRGGRFTPWCRPFVSPLDQSGVLCAPSWRDMIGTGAGGLWTHPFRFPCMGWRGGHRAAPSFPRGSSAGATARSIPLRGRASKGWPGARVELAPAGRALPPRHRRAAHDATRGPCLCLVALSARN